MRIVSFVILLIALVISNQKTESPHGSAFKVSCKTCHSPKGWQLDKEIYSFDHNKTGLPLTGGHVGVNCRLCHISLVFSAAKTECYQCHKDIHQNTVGPDCGRCHTPASWLVSNIDAIHRTSRFPLLGAHKTAVCIDCHKSESYARYDVQGVLCIDCHRDDYNTASNPDHVQGGFSEDCSTCHPVNALQWQGVGFNHNFFPLQQAHSTVKCADCHKTGNYADARPECYSCHQNDFTAAKNPDHVASQISKVCQDCHSLAPGWKPTTFDHSGFPLKLGHSTPSCIECHKGGNYSSIPADCYSCHQADYTTTSNPNHTSAGYSKTCESCHTLNPGWKPATFNHSKFPLTLGHATPVCADCHKNGIYSGTPTDCFACHVNDYNNSVNPNHKSLAFATVCTQCHTTNPGWKPASYTQHDAQMFPIYTGKHKGQWSVCTDCHTTPANYQLFDCKRCHSTVHQGKNYTNAQCYSCHPRGNGG